jgi:hypothetical protein
MLLSGTSIRRFITLIIMAANLHMSTSYRLQFGCIMDIVLNKDMLTTYSIVRFILTAPRALCMGGSNTKHIIYCHVGLNKNIHDCGLNKGMVV